MKKKTKSISHPLLGVVLSSCFKSFRSNTIFFLGCICFFSFFVINRQHRLLLLWGNEGEEEGMSWADEWAGAEGNWKGPVPQSPTEFGLRINPNMSDPRLFIFDEKEVDSAIREHVTLVLTGRESSERIITCLLEIDRYIPPGTAVVAVGIGNEARRKQLDIFVKSFSLPNFQYVDAGVEFITIKSLRGLGVEKVQTKYALLINFDSLPWLLEGEHPLDCVRTLFTAAEHTSERFGAFSPHLVEELRDPDPSTWGPHGHPNSMNIGSWVPMIKKEGTSHLELSSQYKRDKEKILSLKSGVIGLVEDHFLLFRTESTYPFHVKDPTLQCGRNEINSLSYKTYPRNRYFLHIPWSFAAFHTPPTYMTTMSIPYYGYVRGDECTVDAMVGEFLKMRSWTFEFMNMLGLVSCDWGSSTPFYRAREESHLCGGVLPHSRYEQLQLFTSVMCMFAFTNFQLDGGKSGNCVSTSKHIYEYEPQSSFPLSLNAKRMYHYEVCFPNQEDDKCFDRYNPVSVVVVTVRAGLLLDDQPPELDFFMKSAFVVTEDESLKHQQFYYFVTPFIHRLKFATSTYDKFMSAVKGVQRQATEDSLMSYFQTIIPTVRTLGLTTTVHICSPHLSEDDCQLNVSLGGHWALKRVKYVPTLRRDSATYASPSAYVDALFQP